MKIYNLDIEGEAFQVEIDSVHNNTASISVNGKHFNVIIKEEVKQIVKDELARIANDEKLSHLLQKK